MTTYITIIVYIHIVFHNPGICRTCRAKHAETYKNIMAARALQDSSQSTKSADSQDLEWCPSHDATADENAPGNNRVNMALEVSTPTISTTKCLAHDPLPFLQRERDRERCTMLYIINHCLVCAFLLQYKQVVHSELLLLTV